MFVDVSKEELKFEAEYENMSAEDRQMINEIEYHSTYGKGCGFETRWSISKGKDVFGVIYEGKMGLPSPFVPGTVITNRCKTWGYDTSAVVGGKGLWCDVWLACDSAIRNAVDDEGNKDHHVFIERFERNSDGSFNIVTGS